jgi:nickel-dependent lactate racemase
LVEVWLPYGETEVCVRVPTSSLLDIIEPKKPDSARNPNAVIRHALENPIGTSRLAEIVRPGARVTVVLKDSGISTNQMLISALLEEMGSAGVEDGDVTVIVAYDPLKPASSQQNKQVLGEELMARIRVVRHRCDADEEVYVGKTSGGTEIRLNRLFAEADVKVLAGTVEPHPVAGYGGGRELVLPGVAGIDSIRETFRLGIDKATKGVLEGNPVHDEMVEAADLARVDFALNVVRDSGSDIVKAYAGGVDEAFERSVRLAEEIYRVPVENRADIVFVSPGGRSFDKSLQEAAVCLDGATKVTKRKRAIVLIAECASGCGDKEFLEALSRLMNPRDMKRSLEKRFSVPRLMAYRFMTILREADLVLVSAIPDYYISRISGLRSARTANEAYRLLAESIESREKVSFIPYGNLTVPYVKA